MCRATRATAAAAARWRKRHAINQRVHTPTRADAVVYARYAQCNRHGAVVVVGQHIQVKRYHSSGTSIVVRHRGATGF